jgi:hypothetical protein
MHRYKIWNALMPTTAAVAKVTTGTSIKTMLQLAPPSTRQMQIISWGYTCDAVPGSTGGQVELIQTDVAATVTAHAATGIYSLDPNAPASLLTLGTAATGFTATVEGSITATRVLDSDLLPATAGAVSVNYDYQFFPDERPIVAAGKFLRVRATFAAAVNVLTWVVWDE